MISGLIVEPERGEAPPFVERKFRHRRGAGGGEIRIEGTAGIRPSPGWNMDRPIRRILALASGSAGSLAAIALKRKIPELEVRIVRSPDIGVTGGGRGDHTRIAAPFVRLPRNQPEALPRDGRAGLENSGSVSSGDRVRISTPPSTTRSTLSGPACRCRTATPARRTSAAAILAFSRENGPTTGRAGTLAPSAGGLHGSAPPMDSMWPSVSPTCGTLAGNGRTTPPRDHSGGAGQSKCKYFWTE